MSAKVDLARGKCYECAKKIQKAIGGDIIHIQAARCGGTLRPVKNLKGEIIADDFFEHFVVRKGDMMYDRITGEAGKHIDDYMDLFENRAFIDFSTSN